MTGRRRDYRYARWLVKDLNRSRRRDTLADWEIDALVVAARLATTVTR